MTFFDCLAGVKNFSLNSFCCLFLSVYCTRNYSKNTQISNEDTSFSRKQLKRDALTRDKLNF